MMSGRRNRSKGLSENIAKRKRVSRKSTEGKPELDLPLELVELILSRLSSRDRARAGAVCRKWQDVATSIGRVNMPPVLMHVPRDFNGFYFWDVAYAGKTFKEQITRPGDIVWHAKDGWMLLFDQFTQEVAFFVPHTQETVKLPRLQSAFHGAAFSAPPTSPSCVIFTMRCHLFPHNVDILTCRPGDTVWTTANYPSEWLFLRCLWNCVVSRNGIFYCLDSSGHIGVYDPVRSTWSILSVEPLKCMKHLRLNNSEKQLFMAEYNGDIFLVRTCRVVRPVVYKLDEINNNWVKVKHLGGATFFASSTTSLIMDDVPKTMRDSIYFPMVLHSEEQYVIYSLKQKRYCTELQTFDIRAPKRNEYIWIDYKGLRYSD